MNVFEDSQRVKRDGKTELDRCRQETGESIQNTAVFLASASAHECGAGFTKNALNQMTPSKLSVQKSRKTYNNNLQ